MKNFIAFGLSLIILINMGAVQAQTVSISGAGASFPLPLIESWIDDYVTKIDKKFTISYGGGGSGAGITQITASTVHFGASDVPLNAEERQQIKENFPNDQILQIPFTLGAVVIIYNIPSTEIVGDLNLTADLIAKIFQRNITSWSDYEITDINSGLTAKSDIAIQRRSDKSGTTFAFTDYVNRASDYWSLGTSKLPDWPSGTTGGDGNAGVAANIQNSDYSVGYVELGYALANSLNTVHIQNVAGNFVSPSNDGVSAAAYVASINFPGGHENWENMTIVNQLGNNTWPISTFSYLMIYENTVEEYGGLGSALVGFIHWILNEEAQSIGPSLGYAPLPQEVININKVTLDRINLPDDCNITEYQPGGNFSGCGEIIGVSITTGFELTSLNVVFIVVSSFALFRKRKN